MKDIRLFEAVGELEDDLLADAEEFWENTTTARKKPRPWVRWGGLAACLAVAAYALWMRSPKEAPGQLEQGVTPPTDLQQDATPPLEIIQRVPPNGDRPAAGPEAVTEPIVELHFNQLPREPEQGVTAMFALLGEDFVPMTSEGLLDYYSVSLPVKEVLLDFSATDPEGGGGPDRGIYRSEGRDVYFDTNSFAFESADGMRGVYVTLDRVFHMPAASWELPGDSLEFTGINGWELALFRYPDEEGTEYFYTEFLQDSVGYRVRGKNLDDQEFAAVLGVLLEERNDCTPGESRTFIGEYNGGIGCQTLTSTNPDGSVAVETAWTGVLGLRFEAGAEYTYLNMELTPEQAEDLSELSLGDRVAVTFIGEPATIGCVWPQQLISLARIGE